MIFLRKFLFILLLTVFGHGILVANNFEDPLADSASFSNAWSLWQNPAGLAFINGGETSLHYLYEWAAPGDRHHGGGSVAINFFDALTISGGLRTKAALSEQARRNLGTTLTGGLAAAIRFSPRFALGASVSKSHDFLQSQTRATLFSFGFQARPWSFLAMGASYQEKSAGFFSAPKLTAGVAIRPFGNYFTLGIDTLFDPKSSAWNGGFNVEPKISLAGHYGGYGLKVGAHIPDIISGWKNPVIAISADINFAHTGFSLNGLLNPGFDNYGAGISLRTSSAEWESVKKLEGVWVELKIDRDGSIEQKPVSLARSFFSKEIKPLYVLAMLKRIEQDQAVAGVVLYFNGFNIGDARAEEWREAILSLRRAGKVVAVFLDAPSERDYFIATAANQILMHRHATITLDRFQNTLLYFKNTLEKIGIKAEAVVAGSYKSAPRTFTHDQPSKEELEVHLNILQTFYRTMVAEVAKARGIDEKAVTDIFNHGEITASVAKETNLIDHAISEDEVFNVLSNNQGLPVFNDYHRRTFRNDSWVSPKKVVVIPINGDIVSGRVYPGLLSIFRKQVGHKDIIDQIDEAVNDPDVFAIILRINSPGGDAVAGQKIFRAVHKAQLTKPVVADLSDVSASAAYLIASAASHIIAKPSTITGSIGVFTLLSSAEALAEKTGINHVELSAVKNPGPTTFRPLSKEERLSAQKIVDWYYKNFIESVSLGLDLDRSEIEKHADGRVWLGSEAFEKKLINEIGYFADVIESVKLLGSIDKNENIIIDIKEASNSTQFQLFPGVASLLGSKNLANEISYLGALAAPYTQAIDAYRLTNIPLARMPFDLAEHK